MFYSHEILTSRKYGVATVWLVATLGAKSNATKKVTRKAILDVNLRKACEMVIQPEAPMALRLQSNLLYGISRVYDQQCYYVLADAQTAQTAMRTMLRTTKNNDLDPAAGKVRPDQLVLMDDPAFLPDQALPALDFDFANMELGGDSRSSQSMMSIRGLSVSVGSKHSVIGINLPSSSTHFGDYQLPLLDDPFQASSGQKAFGGTGLSIPDDEGDLFQDDMIFEFDPDGTMRDIDVNEREARRARSVIPHLGSDGASARVRKEHEDAGQGLPVIDGGGDFDMLNYGDDQLPDAEAFPAMSGVPMMVGGLGGDDVPQPLIVSDDLVHSHAPSQEEPSFESAEAPQKRRKKRAPKQVASDPLTELRATDLLQWQREYPDMVLAANLKKADKKANAQAKKNAFVFVYGAGFNGVGNGVGSCKIPSPLEMFSGDALLARITGQVPVPKVKKAVKRTRKDSEGDEEQQETPKRARQDQIERENEIGRGSFEDGMMIMDDLQELSMDMEKGRYAPSALADYPSSALMPWNVSASARSQSILHGASGSLPSHLPSSVGRRLTAQSPLVGRGSNNVPGELEQFSMGLNDDDGMVMYGRSDNDDTMDDDAVLRRMGSQGLAASESQFELFGPAAQVDTQTAGSSQWVREALDREGENFFEYVKNTIEEKKGDELDEGGEGGDEYVVFEELFPPKQNSKIVAAQAFYHVLTLATRRRFWVEQDLDEDAMEPFGEIRIAVAHEARI